VAKVINFFGAPGVGKSTVAAEIFSQLKKKGLNVALVTEFANFKITEKSFKAVQNQYYVTSKQLYNQEVFEDKYNIVITDSPILLSFIYSNDSIVDKKFNEFILEKFKEKENINFLLNHDTVTLNNFSMNGRRHKKSKLEQIHNKIVETLKSNNIEYKNVFKDYIQLKYYVEQDSLVDYIIKGLV
jgi:molybdopterin-guanine dinucleotide biosynthesis protein